MKNYYVISVFFAFFSFQVLSQSPMSIENLPDLQNARASHVLIIPSASKYVVVGGHVSGFNLSKKAEIFDNSTKEWYIFNSLDNRDMSFVAKLNDNSYLIGAGCSSTLGVGQLKTAEIYQPETNTFTLTGSMTVARTNASSATLKDGRVLVVGNWYASAAKAEVYDPLTNTFSLTENCILERTSPLVLPTDDGGAIVCGGNGPRGQIPTNYIFEKYDPVNNTFSELTNTLFDGETTWDISAQKTYMSHEFRLPNDKFAAIVHTNQYKRVRIITIDPATSEIAELLTIDTIPLKDQSNPEINFSCYPYPMIDVQNNLLHIVQNALYNSEYLLRIVTIDLGTGSVNFSTMGGFTFAVVSAAISMLQDGRILFTGGMKHNNFNLSAQAFIIKPAIYLEAGLLNTETTFCKAYWDAQNMKFALNEEVKTAILYDCNGRIIQTIQNSRFIKGESVQPGIYFIKLERINGNQKIIKVLKP